MNADVQALESDVAYLRDELKKADAQVAAANARNAQRREQVERLPVVENALQAANDYIWQVLRDMSNTKELFKRYEVYMNSIRAISDLEREQRGRALAHAADPSAEKPTVVCLCGSTRFIDAFQKAEFDETLAGRIVLTIGCDTKGDAELFSGEEGERIKAMLDRLHKQKIDLADEVLILNVGGYVGSSTKSEIVHALKHGKRMRWLEPDSAETILNGLAQAATETNG